MADIGLVPILSVWSIEGGFAIVAVDALRVVLAVLADAASLVVAVDVQGQALRVDVRIVRTLTGVVETVAG